MSEIMSEIASTDLQGSYRVLYQNRLQERGNGPKKKDESVRKVKRDSKVKVDIKNITYLKPQTAEKKQKIPAGRGKTVTQC